MSEKKKSVGRRVRLLKIVGVLTLVLFGPFLLLYMWFALRPTGYEALAGRMEEAEATIQRRVEAARPAVRDGVTSGSIRIASGGRDHSTSDVLTVGGARLQQVSLTEQLASDWKLGVDNWHHPGNWVEAMPVMGQWYASRNVMVGKFQFGDTIPQSAPRLTSANEEEVIQRIRNWPFWSGKLQPVRQRHAFTDKDRKRLAEGLNKAERLLLGEHAATGVMPVDQSYLHWLYFGEPARLGLLAMLRAAASGHTAKAEALLRGQLAAIQELRLASYPYGTEAAGWFRPFISTIMWAARIPEISDDVLARADAQLAGFTLSPEEMKQFQIVYARRATEAYAERVQADEVVSGIDEFEYFFDGAPERGWRRAMGPVLKNNLEQLTVAWAGNDPREWEAAETEHRRLLPWLNVKPPGALLHLYPNGNYISGNWGTSYHVGERNNFLRLARGGFNDEIIAARLLLAAERYRRAKGVYPNSMEALRGDFPRVDEFSTADLQCSILWVDDLRVLELPKAREGEADRYKKIRDAADKIRNAERRLEFVEDLLPYVESEEDLKEVNQFFVNHPGRPVFCFTRRKEPSGPGAEEMLDVNAWFPVNPQIPDWMRQAVISVGENN